jgi:hypothetical protein
MVRTMVIGSRKDQDYLPEKFSQLSFPLQALNLYFLKAHENFLSSTLKIIPTNVTSLSLADRFKLKN